MVTVYVESNFILELAFLQEQHQACLRILELTEQGSIRLAVPAYCIGEPYEKLVRQMAHRTKLQAAILTEVDQMSRSHAYAGIAEATHEFMTLLIESGQQEEGRLRDILSRLLKVSVVVPLDADVFAHAMDARDALDFSPQDAIVFASVVKSPPQAAGKALFLNRNPRDFLKPDVEAVLEQHACKLPSNFEHGLGWIQSAVSKG